MLNKLFAMEKSRAGDEGGAEEPEERPREKVAEKKKAVKPKPSEDDDRGPRGRGGRMQVSQVKLLAEHCYSLSDDQIEELVSAKIPTHSRWESYQEFKDKINRRDELIK